MTTIETTIDQPTGEYLNKFTIIRKLIGFQLTIAILGILIFFIIIPITGEGSTEIHPAFTILSLVGFVMYTADAIPHILRIYHQEKALNFDFNQEMIRENITIKKVSEHAYWFNKKWFYTQNIIVRLDYIKEVENYEVVTLISDKWKSKSHIKITFEAVDGETRSIVLPMYIEPVFSQWVIDSKRKYKLRTHMESLEYKCHKNSLSAAKKNQ